MLEDGSNQEIEKITQPDIHLILGPHGNNDAKTLKTDENILRTSLRNNNGITYYFVETTDSTEKCAQYATDFVKAGFRPTLAMINAIYYEKHGRTPDIVMANKLARDSDRNNDPFTKKTLQVADTFFSEFPGRFVVLFEGIPKSKIKSFDTPAMTQNRITSSYELFQKKRYEDALNFFKSEINNLSHLTNDRDKIVSQKTAQYAQLSDTSAVIMRFGTAHTGISHNLSDMGFKVKTEYASSRVFEGVTQVARYLNYIKKDKLTKDDWYRLMVYAFRLNSLIVQNKNSLSDSEILQLSRETVQAIGGLDIKKLLAHR